jgi:hypothetical protein
MVKEQWKIAWASIFHFLFDVLMPRCLNVSMSQSVLWIRNYFFSDPDPTLTLISYPDSDLDPDSDPACL